MSDYIDELVAKHFACCGVAPCRDGWHQPDCPVKMRVEATDLAEAVAERVRESARVWIPVSERLPEDGDLVLSLDKHGHVRVEPGANSNDFTHWQPLPPPPGRAVAERVREAEREKRVECERALASVSRAMYVYGFKPGSDGVWRPDPPYWNPPLVPPTGEPNGDLYRAKMEIARLTEELHRVLVKLEEANKTD